MLNINLKQLAVYGCSLTKDNYIDTWADILSAKYKLNLNNFAERGAGYELISSKIINTATSDPATLHIIMWPSADRWDLWVNDTVPHLQEDIKYASWLDGKSSCFVDQFGNYNNKHGWYINGAVPRGLKHIYYKYFYTQEYHVNQAWKTIMLIQRYLDSLSCNYIMCNSYPLNNLIQYHDHGQTEFNVDLLSKINLNKFVDNALDNGFIQFCKENNEEFFNSHYPNTSAHKRYVEQVLIPKLLEH